MIKSKLAYKESRVNIYKLYLPECESDSSFIQSVFFFTQTVRSIGIYKAIDHTFEHLKYNREKSYLDLALSTFYHYNDH